MLAGTRARQYTPTWWMLSMAWRGGHETGGAASEDAQPPARGKRLEAGGRACREHSGAKAKRQWPLGHLLSEKHGEVKVHFLPLTHTLGLRAWPRLSHCPPQKAVKGPKWLPVGEAPTNRGSQAPLNTPCFQI